MAIAPTSVSARILGVYLPMIVHEVSARGQDQFLLLRLYIIKYIAQYKQPTRKRREGLGLLYYLCIDLCRGFGIRDHLSVA
jgi:hypothetical protein